MLVVLAFVGCGHDNGAAPDATPDAPPDAAPNLSLRFDRVAGSTAFDAIATVTGASDPIALTVDHGVIAPPDPNGRARVTPIGTGNYTITATAGALTATRTAIVLGSVDETWNQPEVVRGLVNTPGWEDGPSISPDGSVLTFQYVAVSISCLLGGDLSAPACKVVGPIDAPARPRMPGASRVNADGTYVNACPSVGVPVITNPVPPDSLYAVHRDADGSFGDPHPIYYAGFDGCISAFGFQLVDATHAVYAFDNPLHPTGAGARAFRATVDPSGDVVLGTFALDGSNQIVMTTDVGVSVGDPNGPTQGNPGLWTQPDGSVVLFSDDEQGRADLFFNTATTVAGPYAGQKLIPDPVSVTGMQESQPFFDGHTLLFRRELTVLATDWNGGPMDQAASWSTPRTILAPGTAETDAGTVAVVGEPSTTLDPSVPKEMYFIYARRVADGTLDLDVGMVPAR
jgi:hypothetical protein